MILWATPPRPLLIAVRFEVLGILGIEYCPFGCPNPRFGRRGAPTLGSGGTAGRSRGIWEHKKGHFGVKACIFIDLDWIPACHCESISGISGVKLCVFSMLDSESLFSRLLGLNLGVCSLKRKIGVRSIAKPLFHSSWNSQDWNVLGTNFHGFRCFGDRL